MHSVNADEGEARSGDKEGPEGKRQPGRREGGESWRQCVS